MFGFSIQLRGEREENTEGNNLITKIEKPRFSLGRDWCKIKIKVMSLLYTEQGLKRN